MPMTAATTKTVSTDPDGRAAATLTLGSQPGSDNNVVEATFSGNTGAPAAFLSSGGGFIDAGYLAPPSDLPNLWTVSAQPYTAPCAALAAAAPNATPVPTLGHAALALLSGVLGAAGFISRRKKA